MSPGTTIITTTMAGGVGLLRPRRPRPCTAAGTRRPRRPGPRSAGPTSGEAATTDHLLVLGTTVELFVIFVIRILLEPFIKFLRDIQAFFASIELNGFSQKRFCSCPPAINCLIVSMATEWRILFNSESIESIASESSIIFDA